MMRTAVTVVLVLAIVAFAAANWPAFTAPTVLTLGVIDFTAPLGLLMLVALGVAVLLFLGSMALWQARILADSRRHARELSAQRTLAEQAEASRLTALHSALELRMEDLHSATRLQIREGVDSLAAMIGEMDDRLHAAVDDAPADGLARTVGSPH